MCILFSADVLTLRLGASHPHLKSSDTACFTLFSRERERDRERRGARSESYKQSYKQSSFDNKSWPQHKNLISSLYSELSEKL